jgi:predicted dehydrogenase
MRIAVLGLGFMGSTHLKAWKNIRDAEIFAVCSGDERKLTGDLSDIQGNLGGPGEKYDFTNVRKYRDVSEVLRDTDVDAVDICLPTDLHSSTAIAALRAGKHTLVEKPLALTGEAADQILSEAARSGKVLMGAQALRFVPSYRKVAEEIRSGSHGPVRAALFRRRCAAPFWSKWLGDPSKSGGGVFDLLIHDVDYCVSIFGVPREISATGHEDLARGIDIITAALHYDNVPSVVITGGWHHKKAYPFSMEFTVTADGGTFEYSSLGDGGVTLYGADGESRALELSGEDPFEAELRYFLTCVQSGRKPDLCPPEESATSVKLALLLLEARARDGEKIACRL